MPTCRKCGQKKGWGQLVAGVCEDCLSAGRELQQEIVSKEAEQAAEVAAILLTTETAPVLPIIERLEIVTAECVIGMHLFKDIATAMRDTFGGRSKVMQDSLRDARKTVLAELRREAHLIGSNAVVAVSLNYSEISGGGKSMLFLVATGTAVRLGH